MTYAVVTVDDNGEVIKEVAQGSRQLCLGFLQVYMNLTGDLSNYDMISIAADGTKRFCTYQLEARRRLLS